MLLLCQTNDPVTNICHAADKQLFTLVEWAKRIPHFSDLTLEDQVILLRAGNVPDVWPRAFPGYPHPSPGLCEPTRNGRRP